MKNPLKDKIAIVTGGASGIGRALCEELALCGATVIVADLSKGGAEEVASRIVKRGGRATAARVDVADYEEVQSLVDGTAARLGHIDYMFNNAGIAVGGEIRDLGVDHWRRVIEVNLMGVVYGATAAYTQMIRQGSGHIVNTASVAGLVAFPAAGPYTTSKFGVVGLSATLRAEGAALGVKVSVVCPGFVQTNIYEASTLINASTDKFVAQIPFKIIDSGQAARAILKGVLRNKSVIVFPLHARVLWRLTRFAPRLAEFVSKQTIARFRNIREVTPS